MNQTDLNNESFAYSVSMLRMLLRMKLITKEEYDQIAHISAEFYGVEVYCV